MLTRYRITNARLDHASLLVRDIDATANFLDTLFGFRIAFGPVEIDAEFAQMTGADRGTTRLVQLTDPESGQRIELVSCRSTALPSGPPAAHIAFIVPDLATAMTKGTAAGATPLGEITEFSEGRATYLSVPGGLVVELEELFE